MANADNPYTVRYILNPIYWPMWLGFGVGRLCTFLPLPAISLLAKIFSTVGLLFMPERRRITRTNIRLCFPHYSKKEVRHLMRLNFYNSTMAVLETALSWWGSDDFFKQYSHIEGMEHIEAALKNGNGALMLGAHYTTLEIGGRITMQFLKQATPTYKPARNKLFNAMMVSSRSRYQGEQLKSSNLRELLKRLKNNNVIWYAPDQDFGLHGTVFAPFMGVQTTTLTTTARIAKSSGTTILPWYCERLANNKGYKVIIGPAFENFPSGNDIDDATTINKSIEKQVKRLPEQYLWGHRRFKTRPKGMPQVYRLRRDKFVTAYTFAHILLVFPVLAYTIWTALKHRQLAYLNQRIGLGDYKKSDLIIHAASIGEVNAVSNLINLILDKNPNINILLSVNTPSGMNIAKSRFSNKVDYCYMPIDWKWASNRYLDMVNPGCVLITETEIWLNFYEHCYYKGIKNIIINARLSKRSLNTPYIVRRWLSQALQYTHAILARSEEDENNYLKLNTNKEIISTVGNIKYALSPKTSSLPIELGYPYILLASTRDGEEKLLCQKLLSYKGLPLLVIVPRHITRLPSILNDLTSLTKDISVRSRKEAVTNKTQIYIADTFGELDQFISGSNFVIMGGSFEPFGGQNIIEVASAGKMVMFGPHMENFATEAKQFIENNAGIQVNSLEELLSETINLISNPEITNRIGKNGLLFVEQYSDIVEKYYNEISLLCHELKN